jgi:hypothetical protein
MKKGYLAGALLLAALPVLCETPQNAKTQELLRFTLDESPEQIVTRLGRPNHIADSAAGYQSWQYEFPASEESDDNSPPAWFVCLDTARRQVLSVTRNFDKPQEVDPLFPASQTEVHHWPSTDTPKFSVRLRQAAGEALLLAMGVANPGERTTQLVLIRRSALKRLMPWLAEQLSAGALR